jgi:ribosome maturation factor RimP
MNVNEKNIKQVTEDVVRESGYFLIDFNLRGHGRNTVIEVYIDGKEYINAEDCARVSRELNDKLQSIIDPGESYRLDVSSPGIDRPLKFIEQFPKHLNKKFELAYKVNDETKKNEAELIEVRNDELTFQTKDKKEIIVKFKDIVKAKALLSFS